MHIEPAVGAVFCGEEREEKARCTRRGLLTGLPLLWPLVTSRHRKAGVRAAPGTDESARVRANNKDERDMLRCAHRRLFDVHAKYNNNNNKKNPTYLIRKLNSDSLNFATSCQNKTRDAFLTSDLQLIQCFKNAKLKKPHLTDKPCLIDTFEHMKRENDQIMSARA